MWAAALICYLRWLAAPEWFDRMFEAISITSFRPVEIEPLFDLNPLICSDECCQQATHHSILHFGRKEGRNSFHRGRGGGFGWRRTEKLSTRAAPSAIFGM